MVARRRDQSAVECAGGAGRLVRLSVMNKNDPTTHEATTPAQDAAAPAAAEDVAMLKDRLLRLQADFDNFRKRTQRERADTSARANEDLMLALLPVLDHFEIGLKAAAEHGVDPASLDGFRIVRDQLHAALARFGLEPIEAAGKPFDPHQHESVSTMYSDRVPRDEVAEELRRGYRLGSRLLRATQVVVSAGPAEATAGEG